MSCFKILFGVLHEKIILYYYRPLPYTTTNDDDIADTLPLACQLWQSYRSSSTDYAKYAAATSHK